MLTLKKKRMSLCFIRKLCPCVKGTGLVTPYPSAPNQPMDSDATSRIQKRFYFITMCYVFGLLIMALSNIGFADDGQTSMAIKVPKNVQETLLKDDSARVIIRLNVDFKPEGKLSAPEDVVRQREKIARVQEQFLSDLKERLLSLGEKKFATVPYVVINVNRQILSHIVDNPFVTGIELDASDSLDAN